ncbi:MAG: SPOR domain-containing protein [Gemmatimonadota bacterium]|nr:SPOR domain-containing protein [Gemmatimonadota bacterium]
MPRSARTVVLGMLLALASPLTAQTDARLVDALRMAQEGSTDSARARVEQLLQATPPTDTLYPQVLYTAGLVSRNVEEMRRNFSRVSVEYTNSAWADDALMRLGLLDYASGNVAGALRQFERVRNDYPDSPLLASTSEWAARALFDQKKPGEACAWLVLGRETAGDDIELGNRLAFLSGRCIPAPAVDTTPTAKPPEPAARTGFGVQIGAVNTDAAAQTLVANLTAAGFTGYVVQEKNLFKIRAGPWPDRAQAQQALAKVKQKLGGAPFIVKEP